MENNVGSMFGSHGSLTSTLLIGLATFLIFLWMFKFYQARKRRLQRAIHLKEFGSPPAQWLLGHVNQLTFDETMMNKFVKWTVKYGGVFTLRIFGDDFLMVADPEYLATVLKTSGPKDKIAYSLLSQWIGEGILTSDGPHWFRNRRLLTPAFHFEVLKPYTEVFHQAVTTLIVKWKNICNGKEANIEMFEHFSLMTLDSLLKTAFSTSTDCQNVGKNHPYIKAVYQLCQAVMDRSNSMILRSDFIFYNLTFQGWQTKNALKVAKEFTYNIVKKKQLEKKKQEIRHGKYRDFVDMLLDAKDQDGNGLTDKEILEEVDTFMFAGHDTTASALSWFMYNMARFPEHQERCREEINEVLDGRDHITWSDIPKMEYLTLCIKESLRSHGPVPNVGRVLTEDMKFPDGRVAPAGTNIWISPFSTHYNPALWDNPDEFDPSRFSPDNSQGRHSHAYIPFSAGPRNCIGQQFALNELKIVAAQVLKHFHVDVDPDRLPKRMISLVLRSKNGVWLKLKPL